MRNGWKQDFLLVLFFAVKGAGFYTNKRVFRRFIWCFGDSLPDGWGNLLLNRMLRKKGMKPEEMTMLNQFGRCGTVWNGSIDVSAREEHFSFEPQGYDLDDLALQCQKI